MHNEEALKQQMVEGQQTRGGLAGTRRRLGPLGDHVVVEPIAAETTIGGLAQPETQVERPQRGIVRAVGPGKITEMGVRIPPAVEVGDQVEFPSFAGSSTLYYLTLADGVERACLIVRQDELLFNHGPENPND